MHFHRRPLALGLALLVGALAVHRPDADASAPATTATPPPDPWAGKRPLPFLSALVFYTPGAHEGDPTPDPYPAIVTQVGKVEDDPSAVTLTIFTETGPVARRDVKEADDHLAEDREQQRWSWPPDPYAHLAPVDPVTFPPAPVPVDAPPTSVAVAPVGTPPPDLFPPPVFNTAIPPAPPATPPQV